MKTFQLTRKETADLLLSLKGWTDMKPLVMLQQAWMKEHEAEHETLMNAFITTALPPIFEKVMKLDEHDPGFSLNEIVAIGNQVENTSFSVTALQNWVKRDIKEMIGSPQKGKKYSIEQMAILFIVEDLKTALDFDSIRKLLHLIVNDPADRNDDLINPIRLYASYSSLFEELNKQGTKHDRGNVIEEIEYEIERKADQLAAAFPAVNAEQREAIRNVIVIAALSVHTAYFQTLAKRYVSATLFLQNVTAAPYQSQ